MHTPPKQSCRKRKPALNAAHKTNWGKLIITFGLGQQLILNANSKQAQERCPLIESAFQNGLHAGLGNTVQMQPSIARGLLLKNHIPSPADYVWLLLVTNTRASSEL